MVVTTAPPRVLTVEDYEKNWKPQGWQLIIIGPTSTWRQDWGEWEAIRDIVQNALDEAESYLWGYDDKGLWIIDKGKGVAVVDFLLGPPKLKPDWSRGKFGEGMKIATLALLRKGYSVHVRTVRRELWVIFLEQRVNGSAETLAALWRPGGIRVGTEFHIIGYTGPAFERYFAVNLPRNLILAEVPSPLAQPKRRFNQLISAQGMAASPEGGIIYCRDIYLKDITSPFSYNLWGFDLAPDRHGPKTESDMWTDIGRVWCGVSNVSLLMTYLSMVTEPPKLRAYESRNVSMDKWSMGKEPVSGRLYFDMLADNAASWQDAWRSLVGNNVVIRTSDRWDGMVKHVGYTSLSVQWGVMGALSSVITIDRELINRMSEALKGTKVVSDVQLTPRAFTHLKLARAIAEQFTDVMGVDAGIIPPASDQARTAGMYNMATCRITLHLTTLEKARDTVDAMVHELGHHVAFMRNPLDPMKAEDLQPAHTEAMTYVAARVFSLASEKKFDEYLKDAVW